MKNKLIRISLIFFQIVTFAAFTFGQSYTSSDQSQTGVAMYYADYLNGQSTALGEIYNKYELTCAHMTYPKGTLLKVTRLDNNKSVTVRVNDRGAFQNNVIIDLSSAAAMAIDLIKVGKAWVKVEAVGYSNLNPKTNTDQAQPLTSYDYNNTTNTLSNNNQLTIKGGSLNDYYRSTNNTTPATNNTNKPTWSNLTVKDPYATSNAPSSYDTYATKSAVTTSTALSSGYGIQVGSYSVYDNAERQVDNMRNAGVNNTYIKESYGSSGSTLYRVIIGSFTSRADATSYLQRLRSNYTADGIVVLLGK